MNSEAKKLIRSVCRTKREPDRELEATVGLFVAHAIATRMPTITLYHPFCEGPGKDNRRRTHELVLELLRRHMRTLSATDHVPELVFVDPVTGEPRA